jgi:hypothetical protein
MEEGHISSAPPRRQLFLILGGSVLAATVLLVSVVLPAEYGIDPLGTGKHLGLTAIAEASTPAEASAPTELLPPAVDGATILPVLQPTKHTSRWGRSAVVKGSFIAQPAGFKVDSRQITLEPGEGMEIKYHLAKGAGLIYSWTASGVVLFDFHAEPDVRPPGEEQNDEYFESYDTQDVEGNREAHGTLIAPTTGIHGWYWENASAETVSIKLVSSGFYDWIFHSRDDEKAKLKPTDAYSLPSHPALPDEPV